MEDSDYIPVFEATRGDLVESVHYGAAAVVNSSGELVAHLGNPELVTFLRSSAKPFQAIPFLEEGGEDRYHLTMEEVAILCASHSGTDEHVRVVSSFQKKIGIEESHLQCGTHPPTDKTTRNRIIRADEQLLPNRHNCSGKHTGMLAYAQMHGYALDNYTDVQHPVQRKILSVFSEITGTPIKNVHIGIDGCSVPTFAIPLRNAALGYSRLAETHKMDPARASACQRIITCMTTNPWVIAGPGKFDTKLMEIAGKKVITKTGAEGYQALTVLPDAIKPGSPALGIALKISDGDLDGRVRPLVMLEILKQMEVLTQGELFALGSFSSRAITNFRNITVGEYKAAFRLS